MTKKISTVSLILLLFTSGLMLSGCDNKEDNTKNTATTWCILVDMSGVRESPDTRQHYAQHVKSVFEKIAPGDAVAAAFITELSVNEPELLLRYSFDPYIRHTDNDIYEKGHKNNFETRHKAIKDSLFQKATDTILHSKRVAQKTDIITACHVAASIFKQYPGAYRKLIILSDMEEYDGTYNFVTDKLTEKRIEDIIAKEKKSSRSIPDMTGVNVYVAGAASKQSERFFNIRSFWKTYFKECGASLQDEHYSGTLSGL